MLKWIITGAVLTVAALIVRAGAGDTVKKTIFYGGAVGIAALKLFGLVSTSLLSWPFLILMGVASAITDVSATGIDDARAIPKVTV